MKVTVSKPQKSEVTITIEVEESELQKYMDQAVRELSTQVKVDGFRPGKAPREVIERQVGAAPLRAHALDLGLPYFYADAVIQEKMQVASKPKIKLITETPFAFEAVVAIVPEVKIVGHEKIKIEEKPVNVSDSDVEDFVAYFQKQHATHTVVDRAAQKGDRVEVDFDGFDAEGDVPLEGTSSKNHPLIVGEGTMIPGFEDQIIGMKAGDEKTFELTFPKEYHSKKFQGKKVKFKVKLNKVEEVKLPEVTREWIKTINGEEQTPEAFRQQIRDSLTHEREGQERTRQENALFEELIKCSTLELPDALIEEEIDFILDRTKMDIESRGLTWEAYAKYLESQKRNPRDEKRSQAEKQLKLRLILQHLYKIEKLEASDEEVKERLETMALAYPVKEQAKVKEVYKPGTQGFLQVKNSLLLEKLLKKFLPSPSMHP